MRKIEKLLVALVIMLIEISGDGFDVVHLNPKERSKTNTYKVMIILKYVLQHQHLFLI